MKKVKLFEQFTAEAKLVNETSVRVGLKLRTYLNGRSDIVDYELVKPNYYNAVKGGKTNLFKVINSTHSKIKVGSTEDFSTDDVKAQLKAGVMTVLKESVNEAKVKTDAKSYQELSQAIDKADGVSDIWNQLDSKLFPIELEEFEDIFDEWWNSNASSYNSVKEFAKNATRADVENLLSHISKSKK